MLIPLLLMGGIIGRLFREFAVTLTMTIAVSAVVSLTLTPMLASRFLHAAKDAHHGRLYTLSERGFATLLKAYERGLDVALKFRFATLMIFFAFLALSVCLFVVIPKGFFPQQDTGQINGISQAAQDASFAQMAQRQVALGAIVLKDPAVAHVAMSIGGTGNALNAGRLFITLKPRDQRTATADQIIARLGPQLDKVEGAKLFMQVAQDLTVGGRASRTQYQYTLQGSDSDALNAWAPKMLAKLQTLPELRDVATDQQTAGTTLTLTFDRDQASRYGTDGRRRSTIRSSMRSASARSPSISPSSSSYRSDHGALAEPAKRPDDARQDISEVADDRRRSAALRVREMDDDAGPAVVDQPSRPVSRDHHQLQSGARRGARTGDERGSERRRATCSFPPPSSPASKATRRRSRIRSRRSPMLIVAALVVVYLILGILYESYIHPLTIISTLPSAGVGAIATLMLFAFDFSLIALIGIILLIGIVKKNGIMLVDFAMVAERDEHLSRARRRSAGRRCCASGRS